MISQASPLVDELMTRIVEKNPLQKSFVSQVASGGAVTADDIDALGRYVSYAVASGQTVDELAASYDQIVRDTLREQIFFKRHGRYRFSRFDDVASSVYFDAGYMCRYMHGLAITSFLWPNHAAIRRHFEAVVRSIPKPRRQRYLEIGPGHGFYLTAAARAGFAHVEGIDLSPTSVALTRSIVESQAFGPKDACVIREGNFLSADFSAPFDVVVMGEVLEHVEEPRLFLRRIREVLKPGGTAYVTTCANSPAVDHIFLFRSADEVRELCESEELTAVDVFALPYVGTTVAESERSKLPINVALVLTR